jgi:RNA polymerase sigma-70 factor (ECF subfamily)
LKENIFLSHIKAAQEGDQAAFTFLLNHYWSEVFNFILKRSNNETDAEDITIETFSKAFSSIHKYNPDFAFNTWLISIAKNVHIDMTRKRKNFSFLEFNNEDSESYQNIADESPNVEDELIKEQNLLIFKNYIKLLKPHYQEVIELRFFQEMSYNEISEALNEPLNNVKVKIMRARKLLAEVILKQIDRNFTL